MARHFARHTVRRPRRERSEHHVQRQLPAHHEKQNLPRSLCQRDRDQDRAAEGQSGGDPRPPTTAAVAEPAEKDVADARRHRAEEGDESQHKHALVSGRGHDAQRQKDGQKWNISDGAARPGERE
jgi:hypothetical protein